MQFYALSKSGDRYSTLTAKRHIDYVCIECQRVVRLRGGQHKRLHFYHLDPSPTCRLNGKSAVHLAVQFHLQTLLNLKLEEPFPAICRIADCACHERKLILEIQCSPISAFEVKSRISDYNSKGYQVIWILHDREFKKRRLSAAEVFLKRHGLFFYTDMNPEGFGHFYHPQTGQKMDLCQVSHPPLKWWKIFMSKWQSLGLGKVLSKWW